MPSFPRPLHASPSKPYQPTSKHELNPSLLSISSGLILLQMTSLHSSLLPLCPYNSLYLYPKHYSFKVRFCHLFKTSSRLLTALCCSLTKSCPILCDPMDCSMPGFPLSFTTSLSLLKLMSIKSVLLPNHPILCCPLFLLPSIFPTIRVFRNDPVIRIRWPKYWSFSFSLSNEYSGLISFRVNWFDLLELQRTLKNFLQNHNSKETVIPHSGFFMVQLSHLNMTTGETTALTRWTFVSKVMSLPFNVLPRFVIAFLPRASGF